MRIKGSLSKGLLISLAIALIPVAAVSAPKVTPGSTCKILSQKIVYLNKTYTCVKSGKKLVWNKGVVLKVAAKSTPSQSSMPIPTTRREKALAEIKRVYDLNSSYQPTVKYIFANDAPQNFAEMIKEVIPFSSRFWSSEFKPTTDFPIILGSPASVEWVNNEMKRYGHELPGRVRESIIQAGEKSSRGDVVNNARGAITYYVIGTDTDKSIKAGNELSMRGFVAHEYVHAAAVSIIGDRQKGIPGWSVEGSANFYGFAIAALMAEQPITAMNRISIGNLRNTFYDKEALIPHSLNKDDLFKAVVSTEQGGPTCWEPKILCYTVGALFTEVLVADHGHGKFVDWWKLSRKKNWEVAFKEVYGIQIDKWYEEVAIPYVIQESKDAIPEVPAPKSDSTFTQHSARPPRPFAGSSTQTQKPSPTPSPTPSGVKAALESFKSFPTTKNEPQKLNFHFGPNADKNFSDLMVELSTGTMKLFADHYPDSRPLPVFYGDISDLDWVISEWAKYGFTDQWQIDDARKRSPGLVVNYWASQQGHPTLIWTSKQLNDMPKLTKMNLISHHIVHSIQHRSTKRNYHFLPSWGTEGGAEFYGAMVNTLIADFDYLIYRKEKISEAKRNKGENLSNYNSNDWLNAIKPIDVAAKDSDNSKTANLQYSVGMFLNERLVGEFGHQKVMNWWGGIRETLDWKVAFQSAFSTDVDAWYKNSAIPYLIEVFKE
jgi:hypothetical protein